MADIDTLLDQLAQRMQSDCNRMKRWRIIHRGNAVLFNITTIVAPALLAVGITSSETLLGKCLLLAVAVVGGLNVTFKPYLHSKRRRSDMNAMRRLNDEFLLRGLRAVKVGRISLLSSRSTLQSIMRYMKSVQTA